MITGRDLQEWGLPPGPVYKTALRVLVPNPKGWGKDEIEHELKSMLGSPEAWVDSSVEWAKNIAKAIVAEKAKQNGQTTIRMNDSCCPTQIFGQEMIERGALDQIYEAAKLPISVRAAIMPDGHSGIGICIGGVLATDNAIIPTCVGVDIGCRMKMSVFDVDGKRATGMRDRLGNILQACTIFGIGENDGFRASHPVLDDERFGIPVIKKNHWRDLAIRQLGSQGGGNHFCEFGILQMAGSEETKLAVLSHSGSRGMGNKIGRFYIDLAVEKTHLQHNAKMLAWLMLDDEDGQEYFQAMSLAGEYAKACHDITHSRIQKELGASVTTVFENFHNFAWKEKVDGRDLVVHRKGATPAGAGVVGIIPGSMTTKTYIVRGKGNPLSISSSSHGAGRLMSRSAAKERFTMSAMRKNIEDAGVTLIGGSLDECSMAYKDIDAVLRAQEDLVEAIGTFQPVVVRMSGEVVKPWEKE